MGEFMIKIRYNTLTSEEWAYLRSSTPWTSQPKEVFATALENSLQTVAAYHNDNIIGMGRITGDNILSFFIQDVIVLPDYQNKGVGTLLVNSLLDYARRHAVSTTVVSLMASQGKEAFYEKLGFQKRDGLIKGMGMELIINPS